MWALAEYRRMVTIPQGIACANQVWKKSQNWFYTCDHTISMGLVLGFFF